MLNRLYIVVGVIAILALAAAFVVPAFIPWGDYRDRMAAIASEVLGEPVSIAGDIHFSLLPQPKLEFVDVTAGAADAPSLTIKRVVAEFSLIDFVRDRYTVTSLTLEQPVVDIRVAADGSVATGVTLAQQVTTSNISIADAQVTGGTVRLSDARSGKTYTASNVAGAVRLEALRGPFSFQGTGEVDSVAYSLRLSSGTLEPDGTAQVSATLRAADERFNFSTEGLLTTGVRPAYSGTMTYRQPPPKPADPAAADAGQGDLVITSKVEATPAKILLSEYLLTPDENRAATRLQGAADVTLGAEMAFNAVISGGLVALPPRDATTEQAVEPYELVRLLRELPIPAAPGLPGKIGVDIAELNLRAFSLRNVRLDARAHDGAWTVTGFSGELPGDSTVSLAGEITMPTGHPDFAGTFSLKSQRLDALSTLWRKPAEGNPLFAMPGEISARLDLVGETLSVSSGQVTLDGASSGFAAQVGIGNERDLHLTANIGALDAARSAALVALLPDLTADFAFPVTFPKGEFDIVADRMTLGDLDGTGLVAKGSWDGGVLVIDNFAADDLGGAKLQVSATVFGTLAKPELSGSGTVTIASAAAPATAAFLASLDTPPAVAGFLGRAFPLDLAFRLGAPSGNGAQNLTLSGTAGATEISADAGLEEGFLRALSGKMKVRVDARSADPTAMTAQLGLGDVSLVPGGGPMHLVGMIEGNVATSLATTMLVDGQGDSLGFSGNLVVTNPDAFSGNGTLKASLTDLEGLASRFGVSGISLPPLSGTATLTFDGLKSISLTGLSGSAEGHGFSGHLAFIGGVDSRQISGEIAAADLDAGGLLQTLAGPAALLKSSGSLWPDGPLSTGDAPRVTSGRVHVTAPSLAVVAGKSLENISFDLDWDATATRLRNFAATLGDGNVTLEAALCCAGTLSDKTLTGRVALAGVDLDAIVPDGVANALNGKVNSSGQFAATASSVAGLMEAMTGEGTYSVDQLTIAHLDPSAIAAVTSLDGIVDQKPEQVTDLIEQKLEGGSFLSPQMIGSFTIAGGTLRSPNVPISGAGGQLFGSGTLRLADLLLGGSYSLSATDLLPTALVDAASAKLALTLGGTLLIPERTIDASALVDAVMVKAYEAEVARLEAIKAEEEARKAAEAQRLADEAAASKASDEAAAKQAAADAAAKQKAADEAAAKAAADEAARKKAEEELTKPMDLGLGN